MTLFDFIKANQDDYDTYDTDYCSIITVCINPDDKPEDEYDLFCIRLCKAVSVESCTRHGDPVCNWSKYIEDNMKLFRDFANKYWIKNNYENEEDFVAEWMEELHRLLAGYGNEDTYKVLIEELLNKCKSV